MNISSVSAATTTIGNIASFTSANSVIDDKMDFLNLTQFLDGEALGLKKINEVYPVTLSTEWPRLTRLLILSCLAVIGSIGNVFMISSVMIEDHLKKAGNAFLCNIALADLLITSFLIPSSTVVLLAGYSENDILAVCKFQWLLAACSFLVSILTLVAIAIENYMRLCTPPNEESWFNKNNTTIILLGIWLIGIIVSALQYVYDANFDYCTRRSNTLITYEVVTLSVLVLLPLLVTFLTHIRIIIKVKKQMSSPNFKPNLTYTWDLALARTNFYSFIVFIIFWLPFGLVVAFNSKYIITNATFYYSAWFGYCKSCFHYIIYCSANRHFRNAYLSLFNYCCCKTNVAVSRRQRNDCISTRPTSDVRVHIIPGYNMYSYTSPQSRSNNAHGHWSGKRDCHEL